MRVLALAVLAGLAAVSARAETREERDERMQWWREGRFGMFIQWGVYSAAAGFWEGKPVADRGERIMSRAKIPVADYAKLLDRFDPEKFNAREIAALAKEAGMKYIVFTAKSCDGLAMFRSKVSSFNVYDAAPFKRDPLEELADACRREKLKLGVCYAHSQDWHHPGGAVQGGRWDPAQEGSLDDYIEKISVPQLREVLTGYGDVAMLWWDSPQDMNSERAAKFESLLRLQPQIITNNRLGGNVPGDVTVTEQHILPRGVPGRDWETCASVNDTWGYKRDDNKWKSAQQLIRNLADAASKGGNYSLVVGPTAEGVIPAPCVERLKAVGEWMKVNGEAIYGTVAGPFPSLWWGRCTRKVDGDNTTLYLHVFNWPKDGKLVVPDLKNEAVKAYLLADEEKRPLTTMARADGLQINVPAQAPDTNVTVAVLQVKGEVPAQPYVVSPTKEGAIVLLGGAATLNGKTIRMEPSGSTGNIGFWQKPEETAEWLVKVQNAGRYAITFDASSQKPSKLTLRVDEQSATLAIHTPTGDFRNYRKYKGGEIELKAGKRVKFVVAPVKEGWQSVNLREVRLEPVK